MKLLLHKDVAKLGHLGDVVEVKAGYARNYLIPQGLAVEPTASNIKAIEKERVRQAEIRRLARQEILKLADRVNGTEIAIRALANEQGHLFGSVVEADIAKALQEKGFEIKPEFVVLEGHLRLLGNYDVKLHLGQEIEAAVKVAILTPEDAGNGQTGADEASVE
ncbi:MAG: 50S ribosomal protein L9 [Planctomycetes bacterium ADurb.Bin412]|nr:MAG: 50S ribosomal protein L9 [Planctomycetes bacterium ADurb.Bin412]